MLVLPPNVFLTTYRCIRRLEWVQTIPVHGKKHCAMTAVDLKPAVFAEFRRIYAKDVEMPVGSARVVVLGQ